MSPPLSFPANRETIRDALTSLLSTALVGSGKPCQAVYGYQPANFAGLTPVVTVSSAGSERPAKTVVDNRAVFAFRLHVFVLYDDGASWHEDSAEDRLDLIEATIASVVEAYRRNAGVWEHLTYSQPTTTSGVIVGGDEYRVETINLRVAV